MQGHKGLYVYRILKGNQFLDPEILRNPKQGSKNKSLHRHIIMKLKKKKTPKDKNKDKYL
jgi:hypothetical protein